MNYAAMQDALFWIVVFLAVIALIACLVYIFWVPDPNQPAEKKRIRKAIRIHPQVEVLVRKRLDSGEVVTNFDLDKIVEEVSLNCWKKTNIERQRQDVGEVSS
ncbi:hypothetical protein KOE80_06970 [Alcaligenes sp. 13f]|uniref:hypothetical protein n=1 Tax=Alcaligenes sp. 13f TaxID=2841924 RepID=UPI001CF65EED|nr:hypothetical protein [Alcaligenes sp. 13f]MCB4321939.1 hypothetical protein [Alcaligenes sp. 13f]